MFFKEVVSFFTDFFYSYPSSSNEIFWLFDPKSLSIHPNVKWAVFIQFLHWSLAKSSKNLFMNTCFLFKNFMFTVNKLLQRCKKIFFTSLNGPGFLVHLKAGEGLNQDALVFDVLYGYFSLKTWIHGLKWKFGSPVVCRINDQHSSLSSFSVRPSQNCVLS